MQFIRIRWVNQPLVLLAFACFDDLLLQDLFEFKALSTFLEGVLHIFGLASDFLHQSFVLLNLFLLCLVIQHNAIILFLLDFVIDDNVYGNATAQVPIRIDLRFLRLSLQPQVYLVHQACWSLIRHRSLFVLFLL